jgi:serine/threonine-protein kinase
MPSAAPTHPRSPDVAPGDRVAGYRLEEQIGQGGMAVVYRARDERLDRRVALKLLAPSLAADAAFRQRFIRESRAAAAVDHPNIIPVYEAGDAGGALFIAMRYVQGGDVRSLLARNGPLSPDRVLSIVGQVAAALDAAHASGLIHRDIKPANMLLGTAEAVTAGDRAAPPSWPQEHVYLSDFGISKQSLVSQRLTTTGQFVGTLDYIAPEQIEGLEIDGRADQYALACATYELLSGLPPYRKEQYLAIINAHLAEPVPSLVDRRPELPAVVDLVLAKAMAKQPAGRYGTCGQFAADLGRALGLLPGHVEASGPPPADGADAERGQWPATELAASPGVAGHGDAPPSGGGPPGPLPPGYRPSAHEPPGHQPQGPPAGGQGAGDLRPAAAYLDAATMQSGQQGIGGGSGHGPGPDPRASAGGPYGGQPHGQSPGQQQFAGQPFPQPSGQQQFGGAGGYGPGPHGTGPYPPGYPGSGPYPPGPTYPSPAAYGQRPARPRRSRAAAAAAVIVAVVAVAGATTAVLLSRHSGGNTANGGRSSQSSTPASAPAKTQAMAISTLLSSSSASIASLQSAISSADSCNNPNATASAVSQIRRIAAQRHAELLKAEKLQASALPNGSGLISNLTNALYYSWRADLDYLTWAQGQQASCAPNSASGVGPADNHNASKYKNAFINMWNPIAIRFGLPPAQLGQI